MVQAQEVHGLHLLSVVLEQSSVAPIGGVSGLPGVAGTEEDNMTFLQRFPSCYGTQLFGPLGSWYPVALLSLSDVIILNIGAL